MANLITLQGSDPIKGSRETINQNFIAVMSDFAGTSFPTENLAVGMKFYNTDEKKEYRLTALPNTWEIDVGGNDEEITNLTNRVTTLENKTSIIDNDKRVSTSRITATQGIFGNNNQVTINNAGINVNGNITANQFNGALNGNAKTATKATQDNQGNVLLTDYVRFINGTAPLDGNITLDIPSTDNFVQQSDVANAANKIPRFNVLGHLVLPSGAEIW